MSLREKIVKFAYDHMNVVRQEGQELACYCPFHDNTDTPALYLNMNTGLWHCFNADCAKAGRFADLVKKITGENIFVQEEITLDDLDKFYRAAAEAVEEKDEGFEEAMDRITINYRDKEDKQKLDYLVNRGFSLAVLEHFEVGYSVAQERIVVPVRDENYVVVGFIGRATDDERKPKYKYTNKFPRRNILLNLQNAKFYDEVIVVEGSLDHIKVHQSGFPNVISTMGSTLSPNQLDLLNRYFSSIIVFSDNDEAGEKMKCGILEGCSEKNLWVVQYPEGFKDPGEMSENQIQKSISERTTHLEWLFNTL